MQIAIIGTGHVGQALGASLVRAGHNVKLAARDAAKAQRVAQDIGVSAAPDAATALESADVAILAVPFGSIEQVADEIRSGVAGKTVIDVTNPLKADYSGLANEGGPSAAEQLAELLPEARVVKAFNTLFGAVQADPGTLGTTVDALYATSDDVARATVAELITSLGLRPVNAGPLEAARQMEALAWLNMRMQLQSNGDWRATFVLVNAPEAAIAA
jgi:predicted dinucleotide-binding enzyme